MPFCLDDLAQFDDSVLHKWWGVFVCHEESLAIFVMFNFDQFWSPESWIWWVSLDHPSYPSYPFFQECSKTAEAHRNTGFLSGTIAPPIHGHLQTWCLILQRWDFFDPMDTSIDPNLGLPMELNGRSIVNHIEFIWFYSNLVIMGNLLKLFQDVSSSDVNSCWCHVDVAIMTCSLGVLSLLIGVICFRTWLLVIKLNVEITDRVASKRCGRHEIVPWEWTAFWFGLIIHIYDFWL